MKKSYKRKREVTLQQLNHMGYRPSVKESKEEIKRLPGCIISCKEVETFFL